MKARSIKESKAEVVDPAKELLWERPGFLVRRLHQIHVALFWEECSELNITPVQYAILTTLSVLPGLDQTALAQEVGLDRTNTADVVKRLETNGLVYRLPDQNDKRTRNVFLTPKGSETVLAMHQDMSRAQDRMLQPLRPAQRKQFMDLLAILVESNNHYSRTVLRGL